MSQLRTVSFNAEPMYKLTGTAVFEERVYLGRLDDEDLEFYYELMGWFWRDAAKRAKKNHLQRIKYWKTKEKLRKIKLKIHA